MPEELKLIQKIEKARLYCVTCPPRNGQSYEKMVGAACRGGADVIQLRDKNLPTAELVNLGGRLRAICSGHGTLFILNDRVDAALACRADGVHLGQDDLSAGDVFQTIITKVFKRPGEFLMGCSTHSEEQARYAQCDGADYIACGPIFSTPTKPDYPAVGLDLIRRYREKLNLRVPLVAIGGIDETNVSEVIHAGADCVAVVRAVFGQDDIEGAARSLKRKIESALPVRS